MLSILNEFNYFFRKSTKLISGRRFVYFGVLMILIGNTLDMVPKIPVLQKYFCLEKDLLESELKKMGIFYAFLTGCIIAPILEEVICRFYLNKLFGNMIYLFINLSVVSYFFWGLQKWQLISFFLLAILSLFVLSVYLQKNFSFRKRFLRIFKKAYPLFFYLSVLTFAILHVENYQICKQKSVLLILLVLPQLFSGLVLSYVRLKWGMVSSILLHSFNNIIAFLFLFFT